MVMPYGLFAKVWILGRTQESLWILFSQCLSFRRLRHQGQLGQVWKKRGRLSKSCSEHGSKREMVIITIGYVENGRL